ncbi:hypothetical protein [Salinibacter ruber]|uniref:hypothetical protein n=1 Tax=Salinibacter ruber TaxID=146919 RepID=UPI001F07123D|nr:hypothetical protein [Salinibacter ruber]
MIHQDVLMRQIRQFTKAIATLLGQSSREQPDDLLQGIDEACRTHLDGRAEDLRTLPPDALVELCHENDRFVPDVAQTLARALHRMGETYEYRDDDEKAGGCFASTATSSTTRTPRSPGRPARPSPRCRNGSTRCPSTTPPKRRWRRCGMGRSRRPSRPERKPDLSACAQRFRCGPIGKERDQPA